MGLVAPDEFEPVAERVGGEEAPHAGDRLVPGRRVAGRLKPRRKSVDVGDDDPGMRLAGRPELRLDAEMDHDLSALDPDAAALRELRRLLHLAHAEEPDVELAAGRLGAGRDRDLHVIEPQHRGHAPSPGAPPPFLPAGEGWGGNSRAAASRLVVSRAKIVSVTASGSASTSAFQKRRTWKPAAARATSRLRSFAR